MDLLPTERRVRSNGIDHHVIVWEHPSPKATALLLHGFLDIAWSFRDLAPLLQARGFRVIAFDWRGHGESGWIPEGGYYHFPDYVLDLDGLVTELASGPLYVIAHSMGGSAAALYSGARNARVTKLALLEGVGPPHTADEEIVLRLRAFLDGVSKTSRTAKPFPSIEHATKRILANTPDAPPELARFLAEKGTRAVPGGFVWSFDPLHRTTAPMPFRADIFTAVVRAITAPVLCVNGSRGYAPPDEAERIQAIPDVRRVVIDGAGHSLHWTHAPRLAEELGKFWDD